MNLVFLKRNRLWLKTFVWIFFAMFFSINGLIGQDIFDEKFEQIDGKLPTPNSYRTGAGAPGHRAHAGHLSARARHRHDRPAGSRHPRERWGPQEAPISILLVLSSYPTSGRRTCSSSAVAKTERASWLRACSLPEARDRCCPCPRLPRAIS